MADIPKATITCALCFLLSSFAAMLAAQERVIVSHSVRGSLSIGPLLYGIQKGFYKDEA